MDCLPDNPGRPAVPGTPLSPLSPLPPFKPGNPGKPSRPGSPGNPNTPASPLAPGNKMVKIYHPRIHIIIVKKVLVDKKLKNTKTRLKERNIL